MANRMTRPCISGFHSSLAVAVNRMACSCSSALTSVTLSHRYRKTKFVGPWCIFISCDFLDSMVHSTVGGSQGRFAHISFTSLSIITRLPTQMMGCVKPRHSIFLKKGFARYSRSHYYYYYYSIPPCTMNRSNSTRYRHRRY